MKNCETCNAEVNLNIQRETVHNKNGDYCSVRCFVNDPRNLSSKECRDLGCVPEYISQCAVCGGVVEVIRHRANSSITGKESFLHLAARTTYYKGCTGPSHEFKKAA